MWAIISSALSLVFSSLISMCLEQISLGVPYSHSLKFLTMQIYVFNQVEETILAIIYSIFFPVLPSFSSSSDSMMILILVLFIAPQVPETLSVAFSIFCSLCYPYPIIFIDVSSSSQIIFSVVSILLLNLFRELLFLSFGYYIFQLQILFLYLLFLRLSDFLFISRVFDLTCWDILHLYHLSIDVYSWPFPI